jgi:hypothetical protein|tara:strand:+ start:201 stop:539 length:339 start_codon:yes stop_codon:yes gene_type:complete
MNRKQILNKADNLVNGDRAKDYGDAFENHERIADGWNLILSAALLSHGKITPAHVALMMDWVKTSRLLETIDHLDSWVDKCGYSALGAEFTKNQREQDENNKNAISTIHAKN